MVLIFLLVFNIIILSLGQDETQLWSGGFHLFSFYRFQKIYPDNTIIEFPVILNQHKRKQKKRFPVKLIRFGKPRDFLDYLYINEKSDICRF